MTKIRIISNPIHTIEAYVSHTYTATAPERGLLVPSSPAAPPPPPPGPFLAAFCPDRRACAGHAPRRRLAVTEAARLDPSYCGLLLLIAARHNLSHSNVLRLIAAYCCGLLWSIACRHNLSYCNVLRLIAAYCGSPRARPRGGSAVDRRAPSGPARGDPPQLRRQARRCRTRRKYIIYGPVDPGPWPG